MTPIEPFDKPEVPKRIGELREAMGQYRLLTVDLLASLRHIKAESREAVSRSRALLEKAGRRG